MPANVSNSHVWYWQGRYGSLGWLLSAYEGTRERLPDVRLPWAVDNGLYAATTGGLFWDADRYYRGLDRLLDAGAERGHPPLWAVVPDAWGDRDATLRRWDEHAPALLSRGVLLAIAVQDGMTPADLPAEAAVVFVGGADGVEGCLQRRPLAVRQHGRRFEAEDPKVLTYVAGPSGEASGLGLGMSAIICDVFAAARQELCDEDCP